MDKKEQTRLRVQRYRDKQKSVTQSPDSVTNEEDNVTLDVTRYPAILKALVDPVKRVRLEKIYLSLKEFNQEKNVYYGYPDKGISFDVVGDLLEATK